MALFGFGPRAARPLLGALGAAPLAPLLERRRRDAARCEAKPFRTATCVGNQIHTHDTHKITLSVQGAPWTEQGPICNVVVRVTSSESSKQDAPSLNKVAKPYNPLFVESGNELTLLVKRYGSSAKAGSALHGLKPGQDVEIRGPNQQWRFEEGKYSNYVLIAGGTGITPLFQAAGYVLAHDQAATVTMYTFNKTAEDTLLVDDLKDLQAIYGGRIRVYHITDDGSGRPSSDLLRKVLPGIHAEKLLIMVCGPKSMTEAVAGAKAKDFSQGDLGGILKDLGYTSHQVWKV